MSKLTKELNMLKRKARKAGNIAKDFNDFMLFWNKNNLSHNNFDGKLAEIVIFYLLGVIQKECKEYGIYCHVYCNDYLDEKFKTDLILNSRRIQIKYDWEYVNLEISASQLFKEYNVQTVCIPKKINAYYSSSVEILSDLLIKAGQDTQAIEEFCNNAECLDLTEEIWDWFVKS